MIRLDIDIKRGRVWYYSGAVGAVAQVHGDVKVVHGFPVYLDRDPQAESFERFNDLFRKWWAAGPGVSFNCRMLSPSSLYRHALFLPSIGSSWSKVKAPIGYVHTLQRRRTTPS